MAEAHPRANCGIVKAREASQVEMDASVGEGTDGRKSIRA